MDMPPSELTSESTSESTSEKTSLLPPGTLWTRIVERTKAALLSGALLPIPTTYEFVEQDGVNFLVRVLANLVRKEKARQQQLSKPGKDFNPFLPYEEELFVADLTDTHVCILNKFNVVEHHLLMVTREFEEQECLLTLADMEALCITLSELDGLAFYNGGPLAGASQRHKHLQLVPLPLAPTGPEVPIAPLFATVASVNAITTVTGLPFCHAFIQFDQDWTASPFVVAADLLSHYRGLLRAVGLADGSHSDRQSGAYNLLVTRQWMLLVPRSQETFETISVNSLGFVGALLVRDERHMQMLKHYGPMTLLKQVAGLAESETGSETESEPMKKIYPTMIEKSDANLQ